MPKFTLKLDPETRDIVFDSSGMLAIIEGDLSATQNVAVALNTWKGEFFLDQTHGTDYTRILSRDNYDALNGDAEEAVRDGILQEPQVSLIDSITIVPSTGRILSVTFSGELVSGEKFSLEELTLNG